MKRNEQSVAERPPSTARRAMKWLIGYWLLLVLLTHWPNPWPNKGEPNSIDKVIHFSLYAGLAFLASRVVATRAGRPTVLKFAVVFAAVSAFGLLDEWTQPYTRRDFDWFDWLADMIGAAAGIGAYCAWRRIVARGFVER